MQSQKSKRIWRFAKQCKTFSLCWRYLQNGKIASETKSDHEPQRKPEARRFFLNEMWVEGGIGDSVELYVGMRRCNFGHSSELYSDGSVSIPIDWKGGGEGD